MSATLVREPQSPSTTSINSPTNGVLGALGGGASSFEQPPVIEYDEDDPPVQSSHGLVGTVRARDRDSDVVAAAAQAVQPKSSVLQLPVVASNVQGILESVAGMAFVVENDGTLVYANANGRRQLRLGFDVPQALESSRSGTDPTVTAYPFFVPDFGGHTLLVVAPRTNITPLRSDTNARLAAAGRLWHLTRKQSDVLALVVHGHSNKSISERFGCALRTVEAHVSSLLTKLEVESRCALVARFWTFTFDEAPSSAPGTVPSATS